MTSTVTSRVGTVTVDEGTATLHFERHFRHPIEEVWNSITDPEHLQQWYLTRAVIERRKGGRVEFWSGSAQVHVTGRILVWDPPRVFEHERNVEPQKGIPNGERSVIRWELEPEPDGTHLRLTHTRLSPQTAIQIAPATHALLDRLENDLDRMPLVDFPRRFAEVRGEYKVKDGER